MHDSIKYHLGKASYVINLIDGLKTEGVAVKKLINKSSLRYFQLNDPEAMIPIAVMYDFIELIQRDLGIDHMSKTFYKYYNLGKVGAYGLLLSSSKKVLPTILNALKYEKTNLTNSNCAFRMLTRERAIYNSRYSTDPCRAQDFMNDIDLSMQIELVKNANDDNWTPYEIHLRGSDTSIIEDLYPNCRAKVLTNQDSFGLVIDTATLSNTLLSNTNMDIMKEKFIMPTTSLAGKIEGLFDTFSSKYLPGIKEVAHIFNTSESTLKRNLEEEEVSFSQLLERWRFTKAVELLTKSNLKINEISDCLFYSNPPNFIRAFKRWSGLNPTEFR